MGLFMVPEKIYGYINNRVKNKGILKMYLKKDMQKKKDIKKTVCEIAKALLLVLAACAVC